VVCGGVFFWSVYISCVWVPQYICLVFSLYIVASQINKQVRNRLIKKKIHVRIEHVRKSECRQDFLARLKVNEHAVKEHKAKVAEAAKKKLPAPSTC
jgi:hypothetical protein